MTLADLAPEQIASLLKSAIVFKHVVKQLSPLAVRLSLSGRTVAMVFNKRSTRTRVASETAINLLGGSGMFLGSSDIQLGVNETLEDSAKIIGGMADGIMARVGDHADIEVGIPDFTLKLRIPTDLSNQTLAKHSQVPVINALSDRYHPTQILADIMVLQETYAPEVAKILSSSNYTRQSDLLSSMRGIDVLAPLKGKKVAYVGDTNNITNELLVTLPRMGMKLAIASPKGYDKIEEVVWSHV